MLCRVKLEDLSKSQ